MEWKTEKVVSDLKSVLPKDAKISTEKSPQGECYLRDIFIEFDGISDGVSIVGFNDDNIDYSDVDDPMEDIKLVEVKTFSSDSNGGLNKRADMKIRNAYFSVVDYFNSKRISIVDNLGDFF